MSKLTASKLTQAFATASRKTGVSLPSEKLDIYQPRINKLTKVEKDAREIQKIK